MTWVYFEADERPILQTCSCCVNWVQRVRLKHVSAVIGTIEASKLPTG